MGKDLVEMVAIGICNKYLSIIFTRHESHDLLHALGIELIEDIIQQEQWRRC